MDYPREVTSVSGTKRWQAADGHTYDSYEEAAQAGTYKPDDNLPLPSQVSEGPTWSGSIVQLSLGLLAGVYGPYLYFTDQINFKYEWVEWVMPIGWFMLIGVALQGAHDLYVLARGKGVSKDYDPEHVVNWWTGTVGCGLLITVAVLVGLVLVWLLLQGLFDGVSKGTTIVIVLLFGIFLALLNRR